MTLAALLIPGFALGDEPVAVAWVLQSGRLVGGPSVIRVKRDDSVAIIIVSDRADELHVHGYNLVLRLDPNRQTVLRFVAMRTGRFSLELHPAGKEIGVIEIYPR